jgi:hypothetical protein
VATKLGVGGYCLQLFGELWFQRLTGSRRMTKGLFSCWGKNILVSHQMFQVMSEGCSDSNKKTNYITRLETARQIY